MPNNQPRDQRIDTLRLLAAFWVVLFHWWAALFGYQSVFPQSLSQFLRNASKLPFGPLYALSVLGDNAVPLFIIIAAYCLAKKERVGWGWIPNRLKKILFPYWIAFIISLPLLALAWKLNPMLMQLAEVKQLTLEGIIASTLLLQNSFKETFLSPVQAWWFIPILVHLYFLYPPLRGLQRKVSTVVFLIVVFLLQLSWNILIIALLLRAAELPILLRFSGPSYILLFAIGMVLAQTNTSFAQVTLPNFKKGRGTKFVQAAMASPAEPDWQDYQSKVLKTIQKQTFAAKRISVTRPARYEPFATKKFPLRDLKNDAKLVAKPLPSWLTGTAFWIGGVFLRFTTNKLVLFSETLIGTGLLFIGLPLAEALIRRTPILAKKLSSLGETRSYLIYLLHQPIIYLLLTALLPLLTKPLITILPFLVAILWLGKDVLWNLSSRTPFERSNSRRAKR